jgi:hypothetical protein
MSPANQFLDHRISLDRPAYNNISLKKTYSFNNEVRNEDDEIFPKILEKTKNYLKKNVKPSKICLLSFLYNIFPITKLIPKYDFKYDTVKDLLAGLTVGN